MGTICFPYPPWLTVWGAEAQLQPEKLSSHSHGVKGKNP